MANQHLALSAFGEEVRSLHSRLSALGISLPDNEVERGFFGPATQEAVREFQRRNRLPVTGAVDQRTAAAIKAADRVPPPPPTDRRADRGPAREGAQPRPLTRPAYRLFDGYLRFCEELWGRSWNIAAESWRRDARRLESSTVDPHGVENVFQDIFDECAYYISGMAMALPLAAETATRGDNGRRREVRNGGDAAGERSAPRTIGSMLEVPGKPRDAPPIPLPLPARFIDASQGWAVYVVSLERALRILGGDADFVIPFDLGGGRALVAVLGIDYRVSDLGRCQEIALALAANARNDPMDVPGAIFVGIGVNGEFSREAGGAVWGLKKVFNRDLSVAYRPGQAAFGIGSHHDALSVSFPRFGKRRSEAISMSIYSRRRGAGGHGSSPLRSLMTLSGRGQGLQVGGSVSIRLGSANPAGCLCRGSSEDCLCRTLAELDIKDRLPAANGWTEHLSGTFDAPQALRLNR
jgi:Putative peptidoglycan binding domain